MRAQKWEVNPQKMDDMRGDEIKDHEKHGRRGKRSSGGTKTKKKQEGKEREKR